MAQFSSQFQAFIMIGATSTTDGFAGLVPKPLAGDELKFLRGDATWANPPVFIGDSGSGGAAGYVPAPAAGDAAKFLQGDGTWQAIVFPSPGYNQIQSQGTNVAQELVLNFTGAAVLATDDAVNSRTNVSFASTLNDIAALTPTNNSIIVGNGTNYTSVIPSLANVRYVAKNGNDTTGNGSYLAPYLTVQRALSDVTAPTNTNVWAISVGTGRFNETGDIVLPPFTYIVGYGGTASYITSSTNQIIPSSLFNSGSARAGLINVYIGGSTGINFDLVTYALGGNSCVLIMENVSVNGAVTMKGRVGNADYIQAYGCTIFGNLTMSTANLQAQDCILAANFTMDTAASLANSTGTMVATQVGGNVSVTSSGVQTTAMQFIGSNITGTATFDAIGTTIDTDDVSMPTLESNLIITNNAVVNYRTNCYATRYDPTTPANWSPAPNNVKTALDQVASRIQTISGNYVTSSSTSTDNAIARFDLTTGKIIQNSGVIIDDSNNVTGAVGITATGTVQGANVTATSALSGNTLAVTTSATVGTTLGVTGATTLSNTLGVTGATTLTGALTVNNTSALNNTATITPVTAPALVLNPYGVGAGNTSEIRFKELAANGSNYVGLKAPDSLAGDTTYTLPNAFPGTSGYILSSTTGGVLSWQADSGGAASTNMIIGGDFNSNPWQRGTSFAAIANGTYTADRWVYRKAASTAVHTVSKQADSPTPAQASYYSTSALDLQVTTANASIAAGEYYVIEQRIEGYNFAPFAQNDTPIGFWVKSKQTGIFCGYVKNSGNDRSYVFEYTINAADTWEFKTVVVTASPSAGTWNYTNGIGLRFGLVIACGSTFQTTANAWQTGDFFATSNQTNGVSSTSNYLRFNLVSIGSGTTVTPYTKEHYTDILNNCRRYYRYIGVTASSNPVLPFGYLISDTQSAHYLAYPGMRTTPTLSVNSVTDFRVGSNAVNTATTNIGFSGNGTENAYVVTTFASIGAITNNTGVGLNANSANSQVRMDAEL